MSEPTPTTDAEIRKAIEADFEQHYIQSLTPDRGYDTPIDNVKALFATERAAHEQFKGRAEWAEATLSQALNHIGWLQPMAKGWAHEHESIASNHRLVLAADEFMASTAPPPLLAELERLRAELVNSIDQNDLLAALSRRGLEVSGLDGDESPEDIVANWVVAELANRKWPDIGKDPLQCVMEEWRQRAGIGAVRDALDKARTLQQPIVPDQTALVWRIDISRLMDDHSWRQAQAISFQEQLGTVKQELAELKKANATLHNLMVSGEQRGAEKAEQELAALKLELKASQASAESWEACVRSEQTGKAPCGHWDGLCHTEDGGKTVHCYQCERDALKLKLGVAKERIEAAKNFLCQTKYAHALINMNEALSQMVNNGKGRE